MNTINSFQPPNDIRLQFTHAMSQMYQREVPLYKKLLNLSNAVNTEVIKKTSPLSKEDSRLLSLEHHGAIRVGTSEELSTIRRLFKIMGMYPVEYYDLSASGIPVHSTAFRALRSSDLEKSPFRIFCSLLRLDLIDDDLRKTAEKTLAERNIFSNDLINLIELCETQGGLFKEEAANFIDFSLEVFRWHQQATVDKDTYENLKNTHALIADVVSFKGPHINHLTPKVLDIDSCQQQFENQQIKAKKLVEGPPKRKCPILLRQTSFIAIEENVEFSDGQTGTHTARFGEVEQRGIALTLKGRDLYDELLAKARNADSNIPYSIRSKEAFEHFPDNYEEIRKQKLGYFRYSATNKKGLIETKTDNIDTLIEQGLLTAVPIIYEDFLPVSAAGIFTSNLSTTNSSEPSGNGNVKSKDENSSLNNFETSLGTRVISSFDLYEEEQQQSLRTALNSLSASANS